MNRKNRVLNFSKICRTCLSERNDLKPLFSACLASMLMACTSVKVEEEDGFPSQICVTCFHQISRYYSFKTKVEKSDNILRKYHEQLNRKQTNKSIIAQAATDADIDISDNGFQEEILSSDSEDDVKLSVRKAKLKKNSRPARQSKLKSLIKNENLLKEELTDEQDSKSDIKELKEEEIHLVTEIFSDGPPPLVPLIPIPPEQIPDYPADNRTPVEALQPISNETPPLIPIKPLTTPLIQIEPSYVPSNSNLTFFCSTCNEEFNTPIDLKNHVTSMHSSNAGLTCNICKKEFSDRKRLIGHLKGHMVVKQYACKLCGKRYPNPSTFKVHMRTHTGERPFKCQICGKGFIRWAGVVGHMKSHNSNKPFECEICQKGFKIPSNLERHKILHTGSMPFCCSYCGKTFSQSDNLQLHVRTYHTHERPYLCSQCGKGFVSSTRLNRHMWVHTGYKPYVCKICDKAYSNSNDLKNHEKSHNGGPCDEDKPYVCETCNMRFFHACRLLKHMKTHERPYACTDCLKTFSREDVLNKHIINKHGVTEQQINPPEDNNIYIIANY